MGLPLPEDRGISLNFIAESIVFSTLATLGLPGISYLSGTVVFLGHLFRISTLSSTEEISNGYNL